MVGGQHGQPQQDVGGDGVARGRGVIEHVLGPRNECFVVGRGVEEAAVFGVRETFENDVGKLDGSIEPARVEGRLVQRNQAVGDVGVVLEVAVQVGGVARLPGAEQRAVQERMVSSRCWMAYWPATAPTAVADALGLEMVSDDSALEAAVDAAIAANPDVAEKVRGGKVQAAGALIGQVMKQMKGQADAAKVREIVLAKLTP